MTDDATLLRRYLDDRTQAAFTELVERYVDLVYGAALRQLNGDTHRAEDVTQTVFVLLARKAHALVGRPVLAGWLHTSARFVANETVRREHRRRPREQEAHLMNKSEAPTGSDTAWEQLRPVIDDALAELDEGDRDAVLLRFFVGRRFAEIGASLRVSEDAARMRVDRALEKLRPGLARRGITSTSAALGVVLTNATIAAPAGLAANVAGVAMSGTSAALNFWSIVSAPKIISGLTAVVVVLAGGLGFVQRADLDRLDAALSRDRDQFVAQIEQTGRRVANLEARARSTVPTMSRAAGRAEPAPIATPAATSARPIVPASAADAVARIAAALPLTNATHVAYVIDTSGSMRDPETALVRATVIEQLWAIFFAHPNVQFVQVLDADGRFVLGQPREWLENKKLTRDLIERALLRYAISSNSNPVPGIIRAMRSLPESGDVAPVMSVVVLGDEFTGDETVAAARMEQINPPDAAGRRRFSVHAIGFPAHVSDSTQPLAESPGAGFARAMRRIASENGGVFLEAP